MNDFTKEELYSLLDFVTPEEGFWYKNPDIAYELMDKIQSMIDNYCEHKNKCTNYDNLFCEDCGKKW